MLRIVMKVHDNLSFSYVFKLHPATRFAIASRHTRIQLDRLESVEHLMSPIV